MVVYVDVLFSENFILDGIIILATSIICHTRLSIKKWVLASLVGSLGSTVGFIMNVHSWLLKGILSILIILMAFGWKNRKHFMKHLSVLYLTTFTFGGASFCFLFLIDTKKIIYQAGHFLGYYPVKMSILRWDSRIFIHMVYP